MVRTTLGKPARVALRKRPHPLESRRGRSYLREAQSLMALSSRRVLPKVRTEFVQWNSRHTLDVARPIRRDLPPLKDGLPRDRPPAERCEEFGQFARAASPDLGALDGRELSREFVHGSH